MSPSDIAEGYLSKRGLKSSEGLCLRRYRQDWLRFDGQVLRKLPDDQLRSDIVAFLCEMKHSSNNPRHVAGNVLAILEAVCMVPADVDWPARHSKQGWATEPHSIIVQNGILNLSAVRDGDNEQVLSPHTPTFLSRVRLPYNYDPHATCPEWFSFLETVLPESDSRQLLQEIFGYCLTYDISLQKFFLFVGSGGNGKGVTLNILSRLLGAENVSAVPLSRFSGRHDLIETLGKLVNITNEVGHRLDEDILKQYVGGDLMHFDPKHKPSFTARPTAKLVNATNELPYVKDCSDGFWRRLVLVPFNVTIPEDKRDHQLEERLAAELSGILNWALAGGRSLYQRRRFQESRTATIARRNWQRNMNPVGQFFEEEVEKSAEGEVGKQEIYQQYVDWCFQMGHRPESVHEFHRRLAQRFPSITEQRPRIDVDHRPRMYRGVRRKSVQCAQPDG